MDWLRSFWTALNTPMNHENELLTWVGGLFSPRAQEVLELARREADCLNHGFGGTEYVLLNLSPSAKARQSPS